MKTMSNDTTGRTGLGIGLSLALLSALSFGLSGALARGLLDAGWSAGAVGNAAPASQGFACKLYAE